MQRVSDHSEQKGYFTFVQNSPTVDYLELAYLQALSIKATQNINSYAIAVDSETREKITHEHMEVIDYFVHIPDWDDEAKSQSWKLNNEWQAWNLTPFKETVKLDSDILFTRNIDHWWPIMQKKEVCCTTKIRDYEGNIADDSYYRQLHKKNNLPSLYSGFTYFRFSKTSMDFFAMVKFVFQNWAFFRDEVLIDCRHDKANTDEAYAIASVLIGEENCYNPAIDIPTFTHMKGPIQGWGANIDWTKYLYAQLDSDADLTVGFNRQIYPFHYVTKEFATGDLIERYRRILGSD